MKPSIKLLFDRMDHQLIDAAFLKFADQSSHRIPLDKFGPALLEMGIVTAPGKEEERFKEAAIDEDGGLDKDGFVRAISVPSALEPWSSTLPLAKLLAACLEAGLPSAAASPDPVRSVADLSPQEIRVVAADFSGALIRLLSEYVRALQECYGRQDKLAAAGSNGTGAKFQTFNMNAGNTGNFHNGLADRVGEKAASIPALRASLISLRTSLSLQCTLRLFGGADAPRACR